MSAPGPNPFVGRTRELAVLADALVGAANGVGRIVLLVGEPGIGKSRTAEEFARRARDAGAEVLFGRCYEGAGAPAFWPWTQIVRAYVRARDPTTLTADLGAGAADLAAVVPELHAQLPGLGDPPVLAGDQARFRFFAAVTGALLAAGTRRPLVVMLEDLHGADASSLLLLQFLAREMRAAGIVVIGTLRDVALGPGQPLATTLGELVREQVSVRLDLGGLNAEEVGELMARMGGTLLAPALVAQVHARTEGNPLYVTEVVRMLLARRADSATGDDVPIPATVRMAIGRHLGALAPETYEALRLAALCGREFRADVVARAEGGPIDTVLARIDEAVAARVVAPRPGDPGCYRFAHALFGETLVDTLGEARRIALHGRVATALAAGPNADQVVPEIAHHWLAAGPGGDPSAAVAWAQRAGERARDVLAYEEAARWYRQALAALGWLDRDNPALRATLLLGLGEAAKCMGAVEEAKGAFEQAAAIARGLDSAELLTRAALGYAPTLVWGGSQPAPDSPVTALLEEAIAAWHGRDAGLHARALVRLGMAILFGDATRRAALVSSGVDMARRLGDDAALRYALAALLGSYQMRFEFERRLAIATELVRLSEPARDLEALAVGRFWRCVHLMECGDVAGSRAELGAFAEVAGDLRQPAQTWQLCLQRLVHEITEGQLERAERTIRETFDVGHAVHAYAAQAYFAGHMLLLRMLQGDADPTGYRALLDTHPDPASLSPVSWAEAERGRPEEARKVLERLAAADFAALRASPLQPIACVCLAEACAALGDGARAARLEQMLAPHARFWLVWGEGWPLGPVAHTLGLLQRTLGCHDAAARHFEFAIAECRRAEARPFLARSLYEYAVLLRPSDPARAAELLTEARDIAQAIGIQGIARKVAALLPDGAASPERVVVETESRDSKPGTTSREAGTRDQEPTTCTLRCEGDVWAIAFAGTTHRIKDSRGLQYLALLFAHPGREFHAGEIVALSNAPAASERAVRPEGLRVADLGDAGVLLDATATAQYKQRLDTLREELRETEANNDLGRSAHLREEIDALVSALAAAGRGRRAASHAERARSAVSKRVRAALKQIAAVDPKLGRHLNLTVHTGTFCSYRPAPALQIDVRA